jgi:hypothetical protein
MATGRFVFLGGSLALFLAGCAGLGSVTVASEVRQPEVLLPTVARSFTQLHSELHPELRSPPPHGVTVARLRSSHDTHLYTEERVQWGREGQFTVLQFTDTNRPSRSDSPMAAWFLGPDPGDGAPEVVGAVLYRDFDNAPGAEDPYQLLGSMAESFPAPWVLCTPSSEMWGNLLLAYDPARGIKLAMFQGDGPARSWSLDHVEFISTLLPMEDWWREKGYGECLREDKVH